MAIYLNIPANEAHILLNSGAVILVSTSDLSGNLNISPVSWHCPVDDKPATKLLFVCDTKSKTYANIQETERFVICIPHASQIQLVRDLGSLSGFDANKLRKFEVDYSPSEKFQLPIPNGCIAHIECMKIRETIENNFAIIFGEVSNAKAIKGCYRDRLVSEKEMGKTIHYLGKDRFFQPGELIE